MWKAIVTGSLGQVALHRASQIADRLTNPQYTAAIAQLATAQSAFPLTKRWTSYSVAYGDATLALLFGQMDRCFPEQNWDRVAHTYLATAAGAVQEFGMRGVPLGLFSGLAGLCFTTHLISRDGTRYARLLETLDVTLVETVAQTYPLASIPKDGVRFGDYDLISGPTGIGAYLLLRGDTSGISSARATILDRLLLLSRQQGDHPHFFMPPEKQPSSAHQEKHRGGSIDCGMAHGIPGPLALLSIAQQNGFGRPGMSSTIRLLADWIMAQQGEDIWGINWPSTVVPGEIGLGNEHTHAAWCYGSPGVARALWHAGVALADTQIQDLAVEAMLAVSRRPREMRGIPSPILCHGIAGLLQIALRFANDTGQRCFVEMARELTQELLDLFEPNSPLGFRDIEQGGDRIDNPGLINGATGVALTLLAASTKQEPVWDRMFLLS